MDFATALTQQLNEWQDETFLTVDYVEEMLVKAAAVVLDNEELPQITLRREIDPAGMKVHIILETEIDQVLFFPEDISTLRAILFTYDETKKPQIGEPLIMPTRLKDGRIVTEVVEELLKNG